MSTRSWLSEQNHDTPKRQTWLFLAESVAAPEPGWVTQNDRSAACGQSAAGGLGWGYGWCHFPAMKWTAKNQVLN
jgi:hypothetical protein